AVAVKIVERQDVRVRKPGDHLGLALEPGQSRGVVCKMRGQDFNSHLAVQPGIFGSIYFPHAAGSQRADDAVTPDLLAIREGGRGSGDKAAATASAGASSNSPPRSCASSRESPSRRSVSLPPQACSRYGNR